MKVVVYGTLKRGYGNNCLLSTSKFIKPVVVKGYKLFDAGFPVATPDPDCSLYGELWDIGDDQNVLSRLDSLESEGRMYTRNTIQTEEGDEAFMYVGVTRFWNNFGNMVECQQSNNLYEWSR